MQAFRKFSAPSALLRAAAWKKPAAIQAMNFRTQTFKEDELTGAHDNDFWRTADDVRQRKQMRANFIRIQQLPEHSYEKHVMREMLVPKKHAEKSFRERWDLYDWKYALPAATFMILPIFSMELIPMTPMYFLIIQFLWNSWMWYVFWAPRMSPDMNDGVYEIMKEMQGADTAIQQRLQDHIQDNERLIGWESEVFEVLDITDELTVAQVDLFNAVEGHSFRDAISTKLDALVTLELAAAQNIRSRMVTSVKEEVKTLFTTNKTAKEMAMAQAIAILTAGPTAKMGKDVVGEAFTASVKAYQAAYEKLPVGGDEIFVNLEKDMAAVIVPPTFEVTGGNVFETNLIRI